MKPLALFAGSLAFSLLYTLPVGARAQHFTQVGSPISDGGQFEQLMALETASTGDKMAAIVIQGPDVTKDEYKPRAAYFTDKAHWDRFVKLWNQARATPPPAKSPTVIPNATQIGYSFNAVSLTSVTVAVNEDATIEIAVMGSDGPMLFSLRPKDFDDFGSDVAKVSAYFGN